MRLVRVAAGLAKRAALAQQVPALIELDLYRGEPTRLHVVERCAVEQFVLFADELLNMGEDRCLAWFVCHLHSFLSFQYGDAIHQARGFASASVTPSAVLSASDVTARY